MTATFDAPAPAAAGFTIHDTLHGREVTCHGCGNAAHLPRPADTAPAIGVFLLSVRDLIRSWPYGMWDGAGVPDALGELIEALSSRLPEVGGYGTPEATRGDPGATERAMAAVYVTVDELLGGRPLPRHPVTGRPPVGVSWDYQGGPGIIAEFCTRHVTEAASSGALARSVATPGAAGLVLYPGHTAPQCPECRPVEDRG